MSFNAKKKKEKSKEQKAPELEKVPKLENVQLLDYDRYLKRKRRDGRASSRRSAKRPRRTSQAGEPG